EYVYTARPDSIVDGVSVHKARFRSGEKLFEEYPIEADMVCGVPDSGIIAAEGYARASGIPFGLGFMKNKFITKSIGTGKNKLNRLLATRLTVLKNYVAGKRVIIIDDSIIRGETSKHIVRLMREAGAVEVHMLVASPPLRHCCYFGVDLHGEDSMIAGNREPEEIKELIGADSLGYLSLDGLREIAGRAGIKICDGCFSGQYSASVPTSFFVDKYAQKIENH
ncbi:MAG: amidophosphoribosyltransferase, partial [Ruminococcus sp.]|nr:amidophosphoribosyltransferase [Ruminococcus sp.]